MKIQRLHWLFALVLATTVGCGSGGEGAQENSTIRFSPSGIAWTNTRPAAACYLSQPALVQIVLTSANGVPLNNTELTLAVDPGFAVLFDDTNNNLVLDAGELTSVSPTFTTKTESYGTKNVYIAVLLGGTACVGTGATAGLAYETTLSVFSGSNYGQFKNTITSN